MQDMQLRDIFVTHNADPKVLERCLMETGLTLEKAVVIAHRVEEAKAGVESLKTTKVAGGAQAEVHQVSAADADSGSFGSITYTLGSGIGSVVPTQFRIHKQTGELCTAQSLDRDEGLRSYDFTISAVDGGGLNSMAYVKVFLDDINDNRPVFYPVDYAVSLSTQSMPGTAVVKVTAHDKDEGINGRVTYRIVSGNSPPLFTLNKESGVISLSWALNGKANTLIQLTVSAQDGGGLSAQVNARVNISIVPGSVSPPVFDQVQYFFTVPEDISRGASVGPVWARNPPGHTEDIFYSISSGDPTGYFLMDSSSGQIRTNIPLDHEAHPTLVLDVQARSGTPPAYSNTRVKITVSDVNDNAPSFSTPSDSILVPEATEIGSTIYTLHAEDPDSGPNGHVQFDLVPNGERMFSIDRSSGKIRLIGALQYDTSPRYDLKIIAKDSGAPQLSSTFTLLVHVQAEDDNGPIFDTLTYRVEVKEGTTVNSRFLQVRALSQDNGASQVTYHLRADGDSASFGIVPESGWLFVKSTLDRETKDLYVLTVMASSGGNDQRKTGTTTVRVSITDENDNIPKLSEDRYFFTITENQPFGTAVGRVMATDRDSGPNSRLTYRLLQHDPNFIINAQTGDISVRRSLDREHQSSYQLLVMVQDGGTPPRSTTGTIYITVLDENDNAPTFVHAVAGKEFSVQVLEGKPSGTFIASLQAKDPDEGENATVYYSLTGSWAERFTINLNTGELRTATVLHRSERAEYTFTVKASDRGPETKSTTVLLRIQVLPSSRLFPKHDSTLLTLHSVEGVRPGSVIGSVAPKTPSQHPSRQLTYTIVGGTDPAATFVVDSTTGDIYLARELDYEAGAHYTLQINAEDASKGYLVSNLLVVDINIQDRNDHCPEFPEDPVTVVVSEDAEVGASVFTFQALDKDGAGPNSEVQYALLQQSPLDGHFQLNTRTGILSVAKRLDREDTSSFLLVIRATDQALNVTQRKSSSVTARVFVTDENDNAPVFLSPAAVSVMEDQPTGFVVLYVIAQDRDLGENGRVSYQIRSGNSDGKFHLNPSTGSLTIVKGLDREEQGQYNLTVVATDHGVPRRMTTQSLSILIIDVNDEAPTFEKTDYEVTVMENQPAGATVLTLRATDRDSGSNGEVTYGGIMEDLFRIDSVSGTITTTRSLDREMKAQYMLTVYAEDGGTPPQLAKAVLKIIVGDENDHTPAFQGDGGYLEIPENQGRVTVLTLKATDLDAGENGRIEYHIIEGDPDHDFILDPALGVLSTARNLDREVTAEYSLIVVAKDQGTPHRSVAMPVTIRILDINDNSPAFAEASHTLEVPEDVPVGHSILQLSATDEDEGTNGQISYYLGNESLGMFHIDSENGIITTTLPLDREKRSFYSFLAKAVDSAPSDPKSASVRVTINVRDVNDNAPIFITNPLFVNVSRHTPLKQVVASMKAEDKDSGANASILYRFSALVAGFSINSYTGEIQVTASLASMNQRERTLFVVATDLGSPALSTKGVVVIYLQEETYRGVRFPRSAKEVAIPENAAPGTAVLSIRAVHVAGSTGRITYSIVSGNEDRAFIIQPNTGDISIQNSDRLDFESTPKLYLVIQAETSASLGFMGLHLNLQDINDNLPRFQLQNYVAFIWEAQGYGLPVIQVLADDMDQGQNGQVTYAIEQSLSMKGLFNIDPQSGTITTAAILDREIWSRTKLVVTAMDRGNPPLVGTATLTVVVMDLNDNSPTIPLPLQLRVRENTTIGTEITQVTGNDVDSGPALSYTLFLDGVSAGTFGILRYGGHISLMEALDYEERSWYILTIRSSDSRHETEANLTIIVEDVNDNPPEFTQELYQVTLLEHTAPGVPVLTVTATDRDSGENGRVTYHVSSSAVSSFYIDPNNGTLFTSRHVEFDSRRPTLDVLIEARDHGIPTLSSYATIQIQVQDVNDNTPYFHQTQYNASISEDLQPGTTVLTIEATDDDMSRENAGFDYTIVSGNNGNAFQLESSVRFVDGRFHTIGAIILLDKLDFETISIYNLIVAASDRGIPQKSAVVPVVVSILDVNDNPPVFPRTEYSIQVSENAPVSTEVLRLAAHDSDSNPNDRIHYKISSGDQHQLFQINEASGAIRLVQPLDRELQAVHVLVIQASDSRGNQGNFALVPVTIEVKDVNDNKPYFPVETLTTSIRENQPPNTMVTVIHAIDFDTGVFGQIRYTVVDVPMNELGIGEGKDLFSVNGSSGELRSKLTFDYERTKAFKMVVKAVDAGNFSASVTVQVLVTGEDEYDPVFLAPSFNFEVPEGAQKHQSIGRVMATDEDEGADGVILYSFAKPSPYFGINETTGHIYLKMDSQRHRSGRAKRETREMIMDIHARSPLPTSRVATAQVAVDVTNTSFGLAPDLNLVLVIAVAASLGVVVILAVVAILLVLCRSRRIKRKKPETESQLSNLQSSSMQKIGHEDSTLTSSDRIYHQTLPGFSSDQSGVGGTYTRGGSLDPSHSSGRGSAEAAEDDEIRMINEYPRVASITSSMQDHISARGPDSGIQQDADQLSDISCDPGMDTSQWFKNKKGSGLLIQGQPQLYRDDGGGFVGVGCGLNISHPKDYTFPEDGKPSVDGSLTAIVASDEELRGSYNWDYLLNWCPQFQPLASVFTEIARLKDETTMRRPFQPKPKVEPKPRIDPPPLITNIAHPGAKSVPPKPPIGRTFPHLSSLRRSPISHEGSLSSAAMSPSFSPSLSPLAARSPVVSPFGISQGPSASIISTGHSTANPEEGELRI